MCVIMHSSLLSEIDKFLGETGMSDYQFGISSVSNGRLVERLRAGRRVWPDTETRILSFMRVQRQARHKEGAAA